MREVKKATCFFCYAWDTNERYKQLDFLRNKIENESNGLVQVILDCNQRASTDGFAEQNGRDAERADLTCSY